MVILSMTVDRLDTGPAPASADAQAKEAALRTALAA